MIPPAALNTLVSGDMSAKTRLAFLIAQVKKTKICILFFFSAVKFRVCSLFVSAHFFLLSLLSLLPLLFHPGASFLFVCCIQEKDGFGSPDAVVAFVSNCKVSGATKRTQYMSELMKHGTVHSIGKCLHNRWECLSEACNASRPKSVVGTRDAYRHNRMIWWVDVVSYFRACWAWVFTSSAAFHARM